MCNKGCARLGLDHWKVKIGGCYCPDCALKFAKTEGCYPDDLKRVCSRFWEGKEVVLFT